MPHATIVEHLQTSPTQIHLLSACVAPCDSALGETSRKFFRDSRQPFIVSHADSKYRQEMTRGTQLPWGFKIVGGFPFFGFVMASLAGTTLLWPGTPLDRMWALNPRAYNQLAPHGRVVGLLFLLLGAALFVAGTGWFRRRRWGWRLAVAIITTQVLGDLVNAFRGDFVRGVFGFIVAGALLVYLLRQDVRSAFGSGNAPSVR